MVRAPGWQPHGAQRGGAALDLVLVWRGRLGKGGWSRRGLIVGRGAGATDGSRPMPGVCPIAWCRSGDCGHLSQSISEENGVRRVRVRLRALLRAWLSAGKEAPDSTTGTPNAKEA